MRNAVTVNCGCAGPSVPGRVEAVTTWAAAAITREPALVFAQEVPAGDEWLDLWTQQGYSLFAGIDRGWQTRSVLLSRDLDVQALTGTECPNLHYHGRYVAAACWLPPGTDEPVIVASVHASPNPADPKGYGWQGDLPAARDGGPASRWTRRQLWDSDLLLDTLGCLTRHGCGLIAAGDFNETLTGDATDVTWAEEYRAKLAAAGLADRLLDIWDEERPTRFPPNGGPAVQLDHVVTDEIGRAWVPDTPSPEVDPAWSDLTVIKPAMSDHAPIWFHINE